MINKERYSLIRRDTIAKIINMIDSMTIADKTADDFKTEVMASLLRMYKAESEE